MVRIQCGWKNKKKTSHVGTKFQSPFALGGISQAGLKSEVIQAWLSPGVQSKQTTDGVVFENISLSLESLILCQKMIFRT